jgi:O-antigen ligase
VVARACFSPVIYLAREDAFSVLACLVIYFCVACGLTDTSRRFAFIFFLLVLAMIQTAIGAIQFKDGHNFMPFPFLERFDYGSRASGFYVCPNHLAGFLEVVGLFGLGAICWGRWARWTRLVLIYLVGVCYLGLALTISRAGYVSTGVGLVVFAAISLTALSRSRTKHFWKVAVLGIIAAILVMIAAFFLANKSFYLSARAHSAVEDTDNVRFSLWEAALKQARLNPLLGTGSKTYLYYGRQFRSERIQEDPVDAHNDYLHLLAEYGWAGIAGFVFFLGVHLVRAWRNINRLGRRHHGRSGRILSNRMALQISALAAVVTYMVHSAFDFNLHIPANALLLAFVFGIIANPGLERDELTGWWGKGSLIFWRGLTAGIGVFLLVQGVRLLPAEYFSEQSRVALRKERPVDAAKYAMRGLASEHQNPSLYDYLGRARAAQGNLSSDQSRRSALFESAIIPIENARDLAPRDVYFTVELALIYDALGRFQEAENRFQAALQLDPKSARLRQDYEEHLRRWREARLSDDSGDL